MRHRKEGKKFGRKKGERKAFLTNLAADVIRSGKIETTEARAKAIKPIVERFVTIGKKGDLASRRTLLSRFSQNRKIVKKLCDEISPRYATRQGGYLRIVKTAKSRKRDGTQLVVLEFV